MLYRAIFLLLLLVCSRPAAAQTVCPTNANSNPQFSAPGTIFGRLASQWNQYLSGKVDANNGIMCNTTFVGPILDAPQIVNGITLKSGTVTNTPSPINGGDVANKTYVDSKQTGLIPLQGVKWDTQTPTGGAPLPNSPTYNNGGSGVNATLTSSTNTTLVLNGNTVALNDRVLVKDQVNQTQNGVYSLTQSSPWVLTRVLDFNQPSEMIINGSFFVSSDGTVWALSVATTPYPVIIGTSLIVFQQVAGAAVYSADNVSLQLAGNTFSAKPGGTLFQYQTLTKSNNYSIQAADTGTCFDNGGAAGEVDFTLPSASPGLYYCFAVVTAKTVKIIAASGQQIALGTQNSAVGGNVSAGNPFSQIKIYAPLGITKQWISDSSPVGIWQIN